MKIRAKYPKRFNGATLKSSCNDDREVLKLRKNMRHV